MGGAWHPLWLPRFGIHKAEVKALHIQFIDPFPQLSSNRLVLLYYFCNLPI